MGLFKAREDVTWAAPILVLILPHDLLTATEVVRHLLLSVIQGAVHSTVKNWIFILISLKFTWGELCKRPGLRLQIGSMPTSQLTRGSANDLWTFHWVSLCPNSIHWCVELYQLSNYKYDYTVVEKSLWYFVLLYYSYKSWSIFKTRDRFEICWSWRFQNTPYMCKLTKFWLRYLRLKTHDTILLFSW